MANTANLTIGAASVTWKGNDLGHTMGGVTFNYDIETEDLKADQFTGAVDRALTSETLEVTMQLAETKSVDILRYAFAGSEYETSGANKSLKFGRESGFLIHGDRGGTLTLHPLNRATGDYTEDVTLYNAAPVDSVELNYEVDGQRVAEVTFRAAVDTSKGTATTGEGYLGRIGPAIS